MRANNITQASESNFVPFMLCLITTFTGFEILPSRIYPRVHTPYTQWIYSRAILVWKMMPSKYIYQKLAHTFNVCMIVCIEIFLYICTFIDHTYKTRNRLKELRPTLILEYGKDEKPLLQKINVFFSVSICLFMTFKIWYYKHILETLNCWFYYFILNPISK